MKGTGLQRLRFAGVLSTTGGYDWVGARCTESGTSQGKETDREEMQFGGEDFCLLPLGETTSACAGIG